MPDPLRPIPPRPERHDLPRFSSVAVANAFVEFARLAGLPGAQPRHLHDLVYIAQGVHLAETGRALLSDGLMADRDGVYALELREAGCWGTHVVHEAIRCVVLDEERGQLRELTPRIPELAPLRKLLARVWARWAALDAFDLHAATQDLGTPWDLVWNDEERPDDEPQPLPNGVIRAWFREHAAGVSPARRAAAGANRVSTQRLLARPDPQRLRVV